MFSGGVPERPTPTPRRSTVRTRDRRRKYLPRTHDHRLAKVGLDEHQGPRALKESKYAHAFARRNHRGGPDWFSEVHRQTTPGKGAQPAALTSACPMDESIAGLV